MTIEDMFERFWVSYPSDLCKKKRGGKQPALKAFQKINPSEEEFNRMMANMKAQIRADRQDKDAYRWPFVSSYLNQGRYDDMIDPVETKYVQEIKTCSMDKCSNPVHGPGFLVCSTHVPNKHSELLKSAWVRTGISTKDPDYREQCRAYCKERFRILLGNK